MGIFWACKLKKRKYTGNCINKVTSVLRRVVGISVQFSYIRAKSGKKYRQKGFSGTA